ncbi:MAG: D-glutamate deacylase, partial [Gemmatimonadota bacterium]|nr:D-glutamate deacylase [Gemmatimonadota bacterium]
MTYASFRTNPLSVLAFLALAAWAFPGASVSAQQSYDVVLAGGRVMDPESGLDAVRWVGIRDGRIAAISETALEGTTTVDVGGLVVAPGFIDLHAH